MYDSDFDPSFHIIPLGYDNKTPCLLLDETEDCGTLIAVTDNGRISFFPIDADTYLIGGEQIGKTVPLVDAIVSRINQRFPNDTDIYGNHVVQYLAVGVMYGNKEQGWAKFIYEVWGFRERFGELDKIYEALLSLDGTKIGDSKYIEVEQYLSSEPVREWINQLISFLKEQLDWSNYVRTALDNPFLSKEDSMYAISFRCGDFKVRDKPDVSLSCIDSNYNRCVVVVPKPSYQLLDSFVTEYADKHGVAATIGCKKLDTGSPVFMPVIMSMNTYESCFIPLSEFMINKLQPPRELTDRFFESIEFIESDDHKLNIRLIRRSKNLKKGDLFTRDKHGNRVEIYVTHLLKTEKSYSIKELYRLKFKHLFSR